MRIDRSRFLAYIIGLIILSFGVTLTIKSKMGTGAWDALNVGLSKIMFTVGTWVIIVGIILIIINAILLKKRPDFYALITVFIVGFGIDTWLILLTRFDPQALFFKFTVFSFGLIFLSLGISIYLQAKFAPVPIDNLMIAIHSRFGVRMGIAKTIGEIIALVFAFIFNGPIGIGTILVTVLIGPIIHLFHPRIEKVMARFR
ncbi:YczE/YyaS/YitT family protein [Aquibacillus rhizosphaerae]|uniref:YitT family protein n=1 Tax=Aquibacillus rhizosphaerae TaxID=3051431 RepID=A0ABT7L5P2_9BACI|nr:YitT family protein [Aquibacillus sp. LR5S19]MDL4841183.1 YitT family protein [Aquibacillus sp. LR5S19]